jgi:isoleucyl-tRNA synthetase
VALELEIDAELRREGWARDIVRAIQLARQEAGLQVTDRIALALDGDEELLGAAREHQPYIAGETLATEVSYESRPDGLGAAQTGQAGGRPSGEPEGGQPVTVDGRELRIAVALA